MSEDAVQLLQDGGLLRWQPPGQEAQTARVWSASVLRIACRCAFCERDRRRDAREPDTAPGLRIETVELMGSTGVHLVFSDGHSRGIYPWSYLMSIPPSSKAEPG